MDKERNVDYFETRLPEGKDTFTREEVAKLQHSEAQFTERQVRKSFEGFVSQDEFNDLQTKYNGLNEELAPYKQAEFNKTIATTLSKFNGNTERVEDFVKLSGISMDTPMEEIELKATELKESGKYNDLFPSNGSGGVRINQHGSEKPTIKGDITPKTGILDKLFKK